MSFRGNCGMAEHHPEEGEVFVFGRVEGAGQAFAKARCQERVERFRFADNAVCRRTVSDALPRFIDAKAQHFVAEVLPMARHFVLSFFQVLLVGK